MAKSMKKGPKIIIFVFAVLTIIACGYLTYSIFLLSGVENVIRYIGIGVLILINVLIFIFALKTTKKSKVSRFLFCLILLIVFVGGQGYLGYFINHVYSSIAGMNKNELIYEAVAVVMKDNKLSTIKEVNNLKIGVIDDVTSIDGHILAYEIIDKNNLKDKNTILDYEDYTTLVDDLYKGNIDVMITTGNFISLFGAMEQYEEIETETKIITSLEKEYTKEEIAEIEGSEAANLNPTKIDEPFTLLIMGIDSTAQTLKKNAVGNGDALMVVTFNPKTFNATILSIPRDTYVPITCNGNREKKINSAAFGGASCMIKTIEKFLDIKINYYVKINFKGVVNLVDALGGIQVDVPYSFCEQNSSRKWGDNTVFVKEGLQTLNGEQALALSRNRHAPGDSKAMRKYCPTYNKGTRNDYVRGQNQQKVIQAIINKAKVINSPSQLLNILDTISASMDTSFTTEQILSFYNIARDLLKAMSTEEQNIITLQKLYLAGSGQIIYDESGRLPLWNHIPNQSSVSAIKKAMKANLGDTGSLIKTFSFSTDDIYKMTTIGQKTTSGTTLYKLVGSFIGKTRANAQATCTSKGITCNFVEEVSTSTPGTVIKQNLDKTKRIDRITNGLTLTIAKSSTPSIETEP